MRTTSWETWLSNLNNNPIDIHEAFMLWKACCEEGNGEPHYYSKLWRSGLLISKKSSFADEDTLFLSSERAINGFKLHIKNLHAPNEISWPDGYELLCKVKSDKH